MINTFNVGRAGSPDASTLTGHVAKARNAGSAADDEAKTYVRDKMRSALFLIKSVDQRQRTLYKVADSIVRRQEAFFERGISALRPMVLRDVAAGCDRFTCALCGAPPRRRGARR